MLNFDEYLPLRKLHHMKCTSSPDCELCSNGNRLFSAHVMELPGGGAFVENGIYNLI